MSSIIDSLLSLEGLMIPIVIGVVLAVGMLLSLMAPAILVFISDKKTNEH